MEVVVTTPERLLDVLGRAVQFLVRILGRLGVRARQPVGMGPVAAELVCIDGQAVAEGLVLPVHRLNAVEMAGTIYFYNVGSFVRARSHFKNW